jgi:hypothetical protein
VIDYAKRSKRNASLIHLIAENKNSPKFAVAISPTRVGP